MKKSDTSSFDPAVTQRDVSLPDLNATELFPVSELLASQPADTVAQTGEATLAGRPDEKRAPAVPPGLKETCINVPLSVFPEKEPTSKPAFYYSKETAAAVEARGQRGLALVRNIASIARRLTHETDDVIPTTRSGLEWSASTVKAPNGKPVEIVRLEIPKSLAIHQRGKNGSPHVLRSEDMLAQLANKVNATEVFKTVNMKADGTENEPTPVYEGKRSFSIVVRTVGSRGELESHQETALMQELKKVLVEHATEAAPSTQVSKVARVIPKQQPQNAVMV